MKRWTSYFLFAMLAACGSGGDDGDNQQNPACGDGAVAGSEQCDDGNTANGDGCSSVCKIEANPTCGDGAVASTEGCDDGNTAADDGCSATCTVEDGYTCTGAPSTCTENPGVAGGTCGSPYTLALMNNAGVLEGTGMGDTTNGTDQVMTSSCEMYGDTFDSGEGHDHIWQFTLMETRDVYIVMDENSSFDTVMRVMSAPCDVTTMIPEFNGADGCADDEGAAEYMGYVSLPAGTYYIVIDGYEPTDMGTYAFSFMAKLPECGNGVVDPLEFCDDGGTATSDGCDAKCEVEVGYTCDDSEPSVCAPEDPTQAVPPAPGDLALNEFMAADNASDTNCDTLVTSNADEFVELVNVSTKTLDLKGVTIADSVTMRHEIGMVTLAPGAAFVVWGAGTPGCTGVTSFEVASTGQLGLNDGGDTITIALGGTDLITLTYPAAAMNVSDNLSPDMTGTTYSRHNAMSGAVGAWSPGMRSDGTAF
jgi:cysteine-rich repeat protein